MNKPIPPAVLKTWQSYFSPLPDTQSRIICRLIQALKQAEKRGKKAKRKETGE